MYFYQPWQNIVYNLILKEPGDILKTTRVSCNPNNINNEIRRNSHNLNSVNDVPESNLYADLNEEIYENTYND